MYQSIYKTPEKFSDLILYSDGEYLTGVSFENSKVSRKQGAVLETKELPIFKETRNWLECYFSGSVPDFVPEYRIQNLTPFRKEVIDLMTAIPFGKTVTYGDIAKKIADSRKIKRMSAQAVGGAVGWNPIGIIIPCHRVVGANGTLTGYGGGIHNKAALLLHEGIL